MTEATMDQEALMKQKARDYLRTRGTDASASTIRDQVAAAFAALGALLDGVAAETAARRTLPGEWSVQEIADHLLETHRPGLDELRCLLAGQRPPGEAIPAALQSKAPLLRPWPWLRGELQRMHGDIVEALARVPADFVSEARAPLVMVINVPRDGRVEPLHWVEELDWKAYAITWRLHAVDHLNQARKVLAAA
jgi:hypothetical protein